MPITVKEASSKLAGAGYNIRLMAEQFYSRAKPDMGDLMILRTELDEILDELFERAEKGVHP